MHGYGMQDVSLIDAGIAQLARASASQAEGRGFESRFPLHTLIVSLSAKNRQLPHTFVTPCARGMTSAKKMCHSRLRSTNGMRRRRMSLALVVLLSYKPNGRDAESPSSGRAAGAKF